jgi:hypothetical protein
MKALACRMTDKKMYALLQKFAQESSVAVGGHIKVEVEEHSTRMSPEPGFFGFKYEDSQYLSELLRGAESFLYWFRRQGGN